MSKLGEIALLGQEFAWLDGRERSVLRHIGDCQTLRMGTNALYCECGNVELHYNSCRDRHCPLCQGAARARWVAQRMQELLPCAYFHVVFTVPHELVPLALANRHQFYQTLFRTVHESLKDVALNPENLGAKIGGLSVLHTWNQKLAFHPHLHCIIPSGGLSPDGGRWIAGRSNFLVSVRRLSAVFRGKLLGQLESALAAGELQGDSGRLHRALRKAAGKDFVVYAKPPFGGPQQVLKYLGRYTHRVGISEQRIVSVKDQQVRFIWADRSAPGSKNIMTLPVRAFLEKFLLHLLPKGLRKIRYFGFMSNRDRGQSLARVRSLIGPPAVQPSPNLPQETPKAALEFTSTCALCGLTMSRHQPFPAVLPPPQPRLEATG